MTSEVWDISAVPPSLRCATRQAFEAGRPLSLDTQNWSTYAQQHEHTSVQENAEKLLLHIARRCPRPGQTETFNQEMDYTVIDCHNEAELVFFVRFLANKGWVDFQASGKWGVTMAGWEHHSGPAGPGFVEGRCFIAMSFSPEHHTIYSDGIRPAIIDAGYDAVCLKDVATNEDINFRILMEIRKAEFAVADFTGQKGGVYFEAAFALAIRREVFWTCSEAERTSVHFDPQHFQYIFWTDLADLRKRLYEKIIALKGQGPSRSV